MMLDFIKPLVIIILDGGPKSLLAICIIIISIMGWYIVKLEKMVNKKDDRLDEVIDNYHKGNLAITETINQLKLMFYEMRTKL